MICEKLRSGLDLTCASIQKKYFQKIVLINRSDILNKRVVFSSVDINEVYTCANRVYFNLFEDKTGFAFETNENSAQIFATFEKSDVQNIPQYKHTVNILIAGVTEDMKCLFVQLDNADLFAVGKYYDGTIEVFGFEFGLETGGYTFDPHNSSGGAVIKLSSNSNSLEDLPPLIYKSTEGNELIDFDNNFGNVILDINGDFNSDFNNDFNNQ